MKSVSEHVGKWIGKMVVLEGTFPIPIGNGQVAYAPAKGRLVEVFTDGIALKESDSIEPGVFLFSNLRSIALAEGSPILQPKGISG